MKAIHISIAVLLVLLFSVPAVLAQSPASVNQSMASPAQSPSAAEVPRLIKFNGTLLDAQDRPMAGPVGVTFALYSQQTGGSALWMETQNVKLDGNGNYTILLGANSANGVPAELFASGEARWLGIQVDQQPEKERILLVSVPYALKAGDAQTLGGKPLSSFLLNETPSTATSGSLAATTQTKAAITTQPKTNSGPTPLAVSGTGSSNLVAKWLDNVGTLGNSQIFDNGTNVGIGTASPGVALDILGNNAGMRLSGTGTHQLTVTGASSGRLGQDAQGFFFASDTNGKVIKFDTNNGTLNEWMRITSAGNIGIHTQAPAAPLDVNGNVHSSGTVTGTQLVSTIATGTAPLSVASTTVVPNLNASLLGGLPPGAFAVTTVPNVFTADQIISTSDSTATSALSVSQSGTGSGAALLVTQGDTGGGAGVIVAATGTGPAISATTNGSGPALTVTSSGSGPALLATETGTGDALDVQVTAGHALRVHNLGNVEVGGPFVARINNDTTTGTTLNSLAKLTCGTGSCLAIITATSDVGGAIGVVVTGAGTTGKALVALFGTVSCNFDGSVTAGDYVQLSSTVAGDCHDAGATYPTSGQVLGRVTQTAVGAGLYQMFQIMPEIRGF